jgi:nitrite reductase/ring-hydroxylating ferredoxin subunit
MSGSSAYSGYHHRPRPLEVAPLRRTGPGTPAGEYLRRYWHPIALTSEVKDVPLAVRFFGEDLVLFRDRSGSLGLLHRSCCHRGVSLEFGIPQEHGIRCCYHGWSFDVDGTVLETPAEPASSTLSSRVVQGAYPVEERHGLIFAYMGPPELRPPRWQLDTLTHPHGQDLVPFRVHFPCNWLQIVENAADPVHTAYLHAIISEGQFSRAFASEPELDFVETPLGFLSIATRKIDNRVFVRSSDIVLPNLGQFMSGFNTGEHEGFSISAYCTRWVVPVDDENSYYIGLFHLNGFTNPTGALKREHFGIGKMAVVGQTADRPYVERQRQPGDYDALTGQGTIANERNEHLGTSDRGVVMLRRLLTQAVRTTEEGETPMYPRPVMVAGAIATYCHEFVMTLPEDAELHSDRDVAEFGNHAAQIVVDTAGLDARERELVAAERIRLLFHPVHEVRH